MSVEIGAMEIGYRLANVDTSKALKSDSHSEQIILFPSVRAKELREILNSARGAQSKEDTRR